jgi:2-phosphoglycerate kinase
MRAAEVRALYELLEEESVMTVDALREMLRRIIAPERPAIEAAVGEPYVPRMD